MDNNTYKLNNIINMEEHRLKRLISKNASIREFGDRYEYCFITKYEDKYADFTCDSVALAEVFVQLLTVKGQHKLVSIDFPKTIFDIEDMLGYLEFYGIKILKEGELFVRNACEIMEALKFKGTPIILYEKGLNSIKIDLDELIEVTDTYIPNESRVNPGSSKYRNSIQPKSKIFLDDEEIDYIPEIEIELSKDLIIANGHIMVANYIGDYFGCIGFFEEKHHSLPISWIYDENTTVFINIYNEDDRKIVIVEHSYAIDLGEL